MLVMATGTGKTYTAFQIVHRLYSAKKVKKILYIADRNILIDQTILNDFAPFVNKNIPPHKNQSGVQKIFHSPTCTSCIKARRSAGFMFR